jgi:hypothetical protein
MSESAKPFDDAELIYSYTRKTHLRTASRST